MSPTTPTRVGLWYNRRFGHDTHITYLLMLQLHIYGRLLAAHAPVGAPPAGRPSPGAIIITTILIIVTTIILIMAIITIFDHAPVGDFAVPLLPHPRVVRLRGR